MRWLTVLLVLVATACTSVELPEETGTVPGVGEGLEGYHRLVSARSPGAQRWFDQGLQLLYGLDRDEAARAFEEATRADPDCAMAWWGLAVANGPHVDDRGMTEARSRAGHDAAREALRCVAGAMPVERALVHAVARRYAWPPADDRAVLDRAYADAMEGVWRDYPSDPDVGALFADALLHARPPADDGAPEVAAVLAQVLALDPLHPGANHLHVHAIEADAATVATAPSPDLHRLHFLHTVHFRAYAAMMEARPTAALEAARALVDGIPPRLLREHVLVADGLMPTGLHVRTRFGLWEEILAEPEPPAWRLVSRAMHHYARGRALCALERAPEAAVELEGFDAVAAGVTDAWFVGRNPATAILPIARGVLLGELRWSEGRTEDALAVLRDAVLSEDALAVDEPPGWPQPVRHLLGAHLVAAARFEEAERVYRADLERHPENGWSLLGLEQALRGLGRDAEADAVAGRRAIAWERAEVRPTSSCACDPRPSRPARGRATRS